ncbi:nucleotide sugar dehydrogenase [Paenibacillus woosongensis]|uniref:Nucleotide sugar dehydrogenase n=1 Tax=Paenibacillus woosongensis TaxID=307580 RepID=A0A7X2YY66_9BACL|nr:nucleotide sugar dehydrogenase [Paenibacillus woosongensis]MUG44087.1 nucleotide sugar dehydrogenase [Paenibacillus woosongensis]
MSRTIAIIGLGYVGLPLAAAFLEKQYSVIGIDLDQDKIRSLKRGQSYIADVADEVIENAVQQGRLSVSNDFSNIKSAECIIICVPTPLTKEHVPDLSFLTDAAKSLKDHLQPDQLVTLESSTYPGTTREVLLPLLEQSGLTTGKNLFIGFSPERVDPGNEEFPLTGIPKIVSGVTENCANRTEQLYQTVFSKVIKVSSTDTAEMTKLLENTFRFVNISFINEFAVLCDKLNINVWEVVEAASSKPFGYTAFYPGPGIGGHCIPVDPHYLQWKTQQIGGSSSFIELSSRINESMPAYVLSKVKEAIGHDELKGRRILVLGVTFKKNVADVRGSSSIELIRLLVREGAKVLYYDPYIKELDIEGVALQSTQASESEFRLADCVIIATDHRELPLLEVLEYSRLVFDTRNATAGLAGKAKVIVLGGGRIDQA